MIQPVKQATNERRSLLSFLKNVLIAHWRSLLILLIGVYLPFQFFEILAVKVWQNQAGFPWDIPILLSIHSQARPQLDVVAVILTRFGSAWTVLPIMSAIAIVLWRRKLWRSLAYLLTTGIGSIIINRTAKALMHRVRPQLWLSSAPEFDYAFPSGHAMTSMTLVMILLILAINHPRRWLMLLFGSFYVVAIAWTRLYLGVHFPSDILAGWMVAIAWAIGVSLIIKPYGNRPHPTITQSTVGETNLLPKEKQTLTKDQ
ncbi:MULTISPECIES: phosphatase PAP2 family protein [Calothrix]|uniref:Phosphatase PAP2 family protein n=2 Tax=Calothrix TaxID=1186 RepID=A0ABR8ACE4_9CYAN|nr:MULTISPECIES: phosphatase PAP2 family protein [Calothrix]MBD2197389.1 phosphatase PAP2 family protein [Calothrix parietina FACHB-288]MBD2228153.1 phosphatase PAP2 family protein [Calothrix anomala FACHB-343]